MAPSEIYSRFESALVHLQERQMQAGAIAVQYLRDGHVIDCDAIPSRAEGEEVVVDDATIKKEISQFQIRADQLRLAGKPIRPTRGDKIIHELPGRSRDTWVVAPEQGDPEASYTDATHLMWAIDVKLTNRDLL